MNFDSNAFNTSDLFGYVINGNASTFPRLPVVNGSNVTNEELMDFFKKSLILEYQHHHANQVNQCKPSESIACQYYCNGFFKEIFTSYKSMHGYISLAVSIILID